MRDIIQIEDLPKCPFCGNGIRPDRYTKHVATMCNKRASPNPYSDILSRQEIPSWLLKIIKANQLPDMLPLTEILLNSCYYPCSGFDTSPIFITNGSVHSFVFCDYGISPTDYQNIYCKTLFKGYQKILQRPIEKNEVLQKDQETRMPKHFYNSQGANFLDEAEKNWKSFGEWSIWKLIDNNNDNIGPEFFSFIFIPSEALKTYIELYFRNSITPKVIALIQPGGIGKGGNNWTIFTNKEGVFWKTITKRGSPNYLLDNGFGNLENKIECPFDNYKYVGSIKKEPQGIATFIDNTRPNIYFGDNYFEDIINIYKLADE